jgi:general secretion pathway protein K
MIRRQRGTAVFTALFVVVIASAITVTALMRQHVDIRRTALILNECQMSQFTAGSLYWAEEMLTTIDTSDIKSWPKELPATLILQKQGVVAAKLYDMSQLYNMNSIKTTSKDFVTLMAALPDPVPSNQAQMLATAVTQWISNDNDDKNNHTDVDQPYLEKNPPYLAAKQELVSISEVRLISGFTSKIVDQLSPHIIAYSGGINPIKTASGPFYLLRTDIKLAEQQLTVFTLLQRLTQDGKVQVNVMWQSRGTL